MTHLSAEQIAQWIAGQRSAEAEVHVESCGKCRARVTGFEDVLAQFRGAVRSVSAPVPVWRARRSLVWPRLVAVAAIALLLLVPLYREREARRRAAIEQQDTQLLQQVDAGISRAVPDAMDPLVKMVSWNSNEAQK
ncbi:MAG: hypothetical protein P4L56_08740 [Candidatus Sulfopaludibacter sp.]|nr:hypothetical protein [Candidatus Sulfopaludibacter sp.]